MPFVRSDDGVAPMYTPNAQKSYNHPAGPLTRKRT